MTPFQMEKETDSRDSGHCSNWWARSLGGGMNRACALLSVWIKGEE